MARPLSLAVIEDLAIGASGVDILRDFADAQLSEPSLVVVYENRESVDVTSQIKMGSEEVKPLGGSVVMATVGVIPILPDNKVVVTMGGKGERIQVLGTNANAAAQELRVVVMIFALSDIARFPQMIANI